jgi:hypothetical protein
MPAGDVTLFPGYLGKTNFPNSQRSFYIAQPDKSLFCSVETFFEHLIV